MQDDADYYGKLPIFEGFASIMDPARYQPLPDDWQIGLTDVVSSTQAIESGRYKAVNTAGASVIAAVSNALKGRKFPFVFGGDGASFADSRQRRGTGARRRSPRPRPGRATNSSLELRVALVPVALGERAGTELQRGPLRAVEKRLVRDVLGRRAGVGGARNEGRPLRGRARGSRRSAGSHRIVVPLERHSRVERPDPVAGAGAGDQRRSGLSQTRRGTARRTRKQSGSDAAGARRRAGRRLAAAGTRPRGARARAERRESFHAPVARRCGHAARIPDHAFRHSRRRLRPGRLPARGRRQFGFSQVRRQPAHDARLHAGARGQDRAAPRRGGGREYRALRPAPAAQSRS